VHEKGALRQSATIFRSFASVSPTLVFFTPIQKTNATKKTMSVYSTKPCPSVSATNLLKTFILRPLAPLPTGNIPMEEVRSWSKGNRRATGWLDADDVFGVCWRRNAYKVPILLCRDSLIFCHTRQNGITGHLPFALLTGQNERKSSPICFTLVKLVFLARDLVRLPRSAPGLTILRQKKS
jgi:hypothetical protein